MQYREKKLVQFLVRNNIGKVKLERRRNEERSSDELRMDRVKDAIVPFLGVVLIRIN